MIPITKAEKEKLAVMFPPDRPPYYKFSRTMKQDSKRGHYFAVESQEILEALDKIRNGNVIEEYGQKSKSCLDYFE